MSRRVTYEQYLTAVALTLGRRHRPVWAYPGRKLACLCGGDLPCRVRHRVPVALVHWPAAEDRP